MCYNPERITILLQRWLDLFLYPLLGGCMPDLGKRRVQQLRQLEGAELERELHALLGEVRIPAEDGWSERCSLRVGFLVLENAGRLPAAKQQELLCRLGEEIPDANRSWNFRSALDEARLLAEVSVLSDPAADQEVQERTLRVLLGLESCISHKVADAIGVWRPGRHPADETVWAFVARLEKRVCDDQLHWLHLIGLFPSWEDCFRWMVDNRQGCRTSPLWLISFHPSMHRRRKMATDEERCEVLEFVYQSILQQVPDVEERESYIGRLYDSARGETRESLGFAERLLKDHPTLANRPAPKPRVWTLC